MSDASARGRSLLRLLLGRPVANREAEAQKLGVLTGLPAMGLDGLGSAAYGPEAALTILAATGAGGLAAIGPVTWVILLLLAILFVSYWQTIAAYPGNGGSYIVARENLGDGAGLLAAAALMLDYLLNVAVGISAGVGALTSAVPALHDWTLALCLAILAVLTLMNLRGARETGLAWALPTYVFASSLGLVLAWGAWNALSAGGHPVPVTAPPAPQQASEAVTVWLLLRAFASGCTAMTGVEAVSNGVSAFREPRVRHAHGTLAAIVAILGLLLTGVAHVAQAYGVTAMDQSQDGYQSVLSQITAAVCGRGRLYDVTIGSVLVVLCLSANTSFVDFPRLCRLLAVDGFLPRPFAVQGRRLVYSAGILFLAGGAGGLLLLFGGITDRLIPLFAVGAFLSFTLSQAGMAAHWRTRVRSRAADAGAARTKLCVNGFGALATGTALAIILAAKFLEGAWLTVVVVPAAVLLLRAVRRHYDAIERQVMRHRCRHVDAADRRPPVVIIPVKQWDSLARRAVEYALRISPDVIGLHVTELEGPDAEDRARRLRRDWSMFVEQPDGGRSPELRFAPSEYRSMTGPLLRAIEQEARSSGGRPVTVLLPELVEPSWWGGVMHARRERRLRARLLRHGGPTLVVASVPWQLGPGDAARLIAEEEPAAAT